MFNFFDRVPAPQIGSLGLCTVQFNAFLCGKTTTQRMAGGNTDDFYAVEGTKPKSQMLVDLHPDVSKLVWRFNRWHHHVDYKPFKANRLLRKDNPPLLGDYRMRAVDVTRATEASCQTQRGAAQ
jgi:hypothetical protein